MSSETNLTEAIKPLIGMVAGSIAANAALVNLLVKTGTLSREEIIKAVKTEMDALTLTDPKMRQGIESVLSTLKDGSEGRRE